MRFNFLKLKKKCFRIFEIEENDFDFFKNKEMIFLNLGNLKKENFYF